MFSGNDGAGEPLRSCYPSARVADSIVDIDTSIEDNNIIVEPRARGSDVSVCDTRPKFERDTTSRHHQFECQFACNCCLSATSCVRKNGCNTCVVLRYSDPKEVVVCMCDCNHVSGRGDNNAGFVSLFFSSDVGEDHLKNTTHNKFKQIQSSPNQHQLHQNTACLTTRRDRGGSAAGYNCDRAGTYPIHSKKIKAPLFRGARRHKGYREGRGGLAS